MKKIEVSLLKPKQPQTKAHSRNPSAVNVPSQSGAPTAPQPKSGPQVASSLKLQEIVTYKGLQLLQNQRRVVEDCRVYYCKNIANKMRREMKVKVNGGPDSEGLVAVDEAGRQLQLKVCRIGQLINTQIFHTYFELTNQMPKSTNPLSCLYIIEQEDTEKKQSLLRALTSLEVCYLVLSHLHIT